MIQLNDIGIPNDYFLLDEEQKRKLCVELIDVILHIIDNNFQPQFNRVELLKLLIKINIEQLLIEESYEMIQVLKDIEKIINED